MAARNNGDLYDKVIRITHVYLGPTADRFIARQVEHHLHKPPEELTRSDLLKLVDWIRVAMSLLTEDTEVIEEYAEQLRKLTHDQEKQKTKSSRSHGRSKE